ncbi:MAG: TrkH family potassium uptake protein [Planctomycetes bacterium]|nr:TrkH family potassium uptake protein [Planctomycetota bacterium]
MNPSGVLFLLGHVLLSLAAALVVPASLAFATAGPDRVAFVVSILTVTAAGAALVWVHRQPLGFRFERNDAFLLVTSAWIVASLVGGLPWVVYKGPTFAVDALFEGAAGFTTTGASILQEVEAEPAGLILWRSLTQWLGGMGIIVLGIAVLPKLNRGGLDLLGAEAPGPIAEKLTPRIARTAKALWGIYVLLTMAEALALWGAGMTPLEAVNHAFTTLSTGGFSTRNGGVGDFSSPTIEWIITAFMLAAGVNFALYFHLLRGRAEALCRDPEVRGYLAVAAAATLVVAGTLVTQQGHGLEKGLRLAAFQVVSVITTTGFASADYDFGHWPSLACVLLFCLMFVGGCAGSTTGSVKVVRVQVLLKKLAADLRRIVRPHEVVPVRQGQRAIPPDVVSAVTTFLHLFMLLFVAGGVLLVVCGLEPLTAFSASAACLANIGPGFSDVGPAQNYGGLNTPAKLILTALMIVGRLELYTVLVLPLLIQRLRRRPGPTSVEIYTPPEDSGEGVDVPVERWVSGRYGLPVPDKRSLDPVSEAGEDTAEDLGGPPSENPSSGESST